MTKQPNLVPKRRFKEFQNTHTWEQRKVGDIGAIRTCKRIFKEQTKEEGDIPFYKNGTLGLKADAYIARDIYEEYKKLYPFPKAGDVLMSVVGSIGRTAEYKGNDEYFQDSNIVWLDTDSNVIDKRFLQISYQIIDWIIEGSTVKHLYNDNILASQIWMTSLDEQRKIGEYFYSLDHLITLHQCKLEKMKALKSAYLSEMFPAEGEYAPKRRFAGFTQPWERRKLGDVSPLRGGYAFQSVRFKESGVPIIRISNILSNEEVGGEFAYYQEQLDDSKYTLPDGAALLAMSGATTGKVSILKNSENKKIYQNQRVGYFSDKNIVDYTFISIITRSQHFTTQLKSVLVAGAQPNISSKEVDNFEFYFPTDKEEQIKIGEFFRKIDHIISLHQRQLEKLQNLKKAYLNEMFV